ncbi:hypothetical protein AB8Z38_16815 [Bradyrhizobium sp. LLZ17]|uniref:Uncharacterized protein n=1 Tax=Bradyrhizobium sp. LLZ17 TaxID=3239388 RepID=A0AB39XS81_9BRAD
MLAADRRDRHRRALASLNPATLDAILLDSSANTPEPMPRDLSTGGVNHDYDRARITVIFGIAGDIPSDKGSVFDR